MQKPSKPLQTQVIYLFAILCGVLAAFMFLYSMNDRRLSDSPKSISSPAPVSAVESVNPTQASRDANPAEKTLRAPAAKTLIETLGPMDPDARWEVSEHADGRPSHILGGRIKCADRECNSTSVAHVLKAVAASLDVDGDSLRQTGISVGSNTYQLEQYYQGYRVFNSSIKAYANSGNTEIYHILNDLRKIESAETKQSISKSEARARFARRFSIEDESKILVVNDEPVIFGETPTKNQLVWRIQYSQRVPTPRSLEAFVNTSDGHITIRSGQ